MGVLTIRALLFGVFLRTADFENSLIQYNTTPSNHGPTVQNPLKPTGPSIYMVLEDILGPPNKDTGTLSGLLP